MGIRTFHDRVSLRLCGEIADVRLIRPERMNALDGPMFEGLAEVLEVLGSSSVRAVTLSGEGGNFCAGLDKSMFGQILNGEKSSGIPADLLPRTHGHANLPQHVALGWRLLEIPVIAALDGAVLGGGLQIALGADVRIVAPATRLALLEMRWGLVPDMAAFVLLPPLLRDDVFRELLFSARTVGAEEAVRLGLATRLADDPHSAAMAMASQMARSSRSALAAAKRLANHASHLLMEVLMAESVEQQRLIGSPEQCLASAAMLAGKADLAKSP